MQIQAGPLKLLELSAEGNRYLQQHVALDKPLSSKDLSVSVLHQQTSFHGHVCETLLVPCLWEEA